MGQPTILNPNSDESAASADSTIYGHAGGSGRTDQDLSTSVTIPAEANTVIIAATILGEDHADARVNEITISGIGSPIYTFDNFGYLDDSDQTVSANLLAFRVNVYDVSGLGAQTGLTAHADFSASTDKSCLAGVICTDGFLHEASIINKTVGSKVIDDKFLVSDPDNSLLVNLHVNESLSTATLTGQESTTVVFKSTDSLPASQTEISMGCLSQSNFTGTGTIKNCNVAANYSSTNSRVMLVLKLHSEKDPYHGITGRLTSPIVK